MSISLSFCDATGGGATSVGAAGIVAEVSTEFAVLKVISAPPPAIIGGDGDRVHTAYAVEIDEDAAWSHSKESEFSRLAALKAKEMASPDQVAALERLRIHRRRTKNPMSADEVVFQYRRREMETKLRDL